MAGTEAIATETPKRSWKRKLIWLAAGTCVLTACIAIRYMWGPDAASAQAPRVQNRAPASAVGPQRTVPRPAATANRAAQAAAASTATGTKKTSQVVAVVNSREIGRQTLANACLMRYGKEVLESLVNKHLIIYACRQRGVQITVDEIEKEIDEVAKKFRIDRDQWMAMLQNERGINPQQYRQDIIWPTLALRKLARDRVEPTREELSQAFDREFGEAVQVRMILVADLQLARRLHTQVAADAEQFSRLARQHSTDITSGSAGGLVPPIHRFSGNDKVEQAVFQLNEGDISPIVGIGEQYAIFRCERKIPARTDVKFSEVRSQLEGVIRERKMREVAGDIFKQVQQDARVVNVLNDPEMSRQMPGVAATINNQPISMRELAEACLTRHAEAVLDSEINRTLLEQELKKRNVQVTREDLDAEMSHAAELAGVITPAGTADLKKWIEMVTTQQGVSFDVYIEDAVWPSTALKKLVGQSVEVTEVDMQKGFDANYGPRVKCRAIVLSNLRRAQEVWDKARQNPTVDNFGKLAKQYSIEASSREFNGEVPPIRKNGGRPVLEREAFNLQPGEISGVVQVNDKYVILYCEGFTEPEKFDLAEVRSFIHRDLYEKKLRVAMATEFERIREHAQIDNYVAGTSQSPPKAKVANRPQLPAPAAGPRR